jgi:hypothetical protein
LNLILIFCVLGIAVRLIVIFVNCIPSSRKRTLVIVFLFRSSHRTENPSNLMTGREITADIPCAMGLVSLKQRMMIRVSQ